MRIQCGTILAAAICACGAAFAEMFRRDAPTDLYLLIGQSNMAGRGVTNAANRLSSERVFKFTKDCKWDEGVEPIHFDRPFTGAGPGLAFVRAIADADKNVTIGLIPCAEGGSPLSRWEPGRDLYTNAVARTRAAIATGGRLRGILWHQGETDCWDMALVESYARRLTNMVMRLRADLGAGDVPFIAGAVGYYYDIRLQKHGKLSIVSLLNSQIMAAASLLPVAGMVAADGLEPGPDGIHFTTESAYELGRRYARELRRLRHEPEPPIAATPRRQHRFDDTTWWDPYVENITDVDTYLRRKFRQDVTDKTTGLSQEELGKRLAVVCMEGREKGESWRIIKAKCFAAEVMEQSIDVSPLDWFPAIAIWNRHNLPIKTSVMFVRADEINGKELSADVKREWNEGNYNGDWALWQDFDHSVPDWRTIVKLGFPGMKARLEKYAVRGDPFYEGLHIAMDAMLAGIDRFIEQGKKNLAKMHSDGTLAVGAGATAVAPSLCKEIACLERLRNGPPQTAYDAMMFVWLYFFWSEHLDGIQCRSLTELDVFLTPYYDADIVAGRTSEAEFREQLKHFLWQWGSVNNYWNQPVGLGGTKKDGTSEFNHVSKIILEVMDECALSTPKFLVKIVPNTPDRIFDKMLDMARRHRSIAFIGEEPAARAMKKWMGADDEDCRTMVVRGCFEFDLADSCNRTGVGHINFLKIVEKMLAQCAGSEEVATGGWRDFESFKAEYLKRLAATTSRAREIAFEFEKVLPEVNPANLMTISTEHALKTHKDGFANGCPRGNNSAILAVGTGTTVDALLAVKELVYEKREMSLAALGRIMAENWKGHELLRLRMLRSKRKWGNNDQEANSLGAELIDCFAAQLNGKPNSRGGVFLASGHCARQFIALGAKTGATPDGRKAGEEMSKNLSPTMGVDTEGATALVETLAASDVTKLPGDYPLDIMLHPSVCAGEKGLALMKTLVRRFHRNGGSVVQFTVFSAEELKDAQAHPEKYENLQVRVCGWNVRWNDLSKAEQDAYIVRAENVMKAW